MIDRQIYRQIDKQIDITVVDIYCGEIKKKKSMNNKEECKPPVNT